MKALARWTGQRIHYAWIVAGAVFLALLTAAGVRSMPGVLLVPLMNDLGWDRATISFAISVGIALYGLTGPFAAAVMQRFGIRRTLLAALFLLSLSVASTTLVRTPWQMVLTWGVLTGVGTGTVALVLGATVVNRWFKKRRGLAMGLLTASTATGQLVFLPILASMVETTGWRTASLVVAAATAAVIPIIFLLVPEHPADVSVRPFGAETDDSGVPSRGNPLTNAFAALGRGVRKPVFWLLWSSFFVCGLSTNGLIGTHMIALCLDHGLPEVKAAGLLAAMGLLDLVGTTLSGWLSDRYDNRMLLAWYYGLRGLSLLFLPFSDFSFFELSLFAVFYGLDWIATVPPTVRLATESFGDGDAPILFGWISAGHQLGAATAAFGAGLLRSELDSYLHAFLIAGAACILIAITLLGARWGRDPAVAPAGE
ncbi:MFS transporter [Telmatospirillum sp.]|uniref:MFS transporter n=1 Tax=Telmatospirillum sp. TaxID=2079197 RepID=UPI002845D4CA|nr:MFS transporter [Telmatospirillum sp.]MDR3440623.1 MFS transporter [Telmatospirillum sp.]